MGSAILSFGHLFALGVVMGMALPIALVLLDVVITSLDDLVYSIGNGAESGHCIKMDTFGIHRVSCISGDSASYGYLVISSKYFPLMKVHRFVPSHHTGCIWKEWIHPRIHVEMDGLCWIDLFWTSVIYGWAMICGFQRFLEACILHDVFDKCQWRLIMFLCKTMFAGNWFLESCGNLMWRWWNAGFAIAWQFGCRLFSSHVHARQQTPNLCQPGFISTTLWTRCFWQRFASCMWASGNFVLPSGMFFKQRLHGRLFHRELWDDFFWLWNLMLQHGARQQNKRQKGNTNGTVASSLDIWLCPFRVACVWKGESEVEHLEVWGFGLACFCKEFIGIAATAWTAGAGTARTRPVVVTLNFRIVAELRLRRRTRVRWSREEVIQERCNHQD